MKLESIAELMEQGSLGIRGQTIFINAYPAAALEGFLLVDPFGGTTINHELPGYRKGSFQVIYRATDFEAGRAKIEAAALALTLYETTIPLMAIKYMRPRHDPFPFPVSPGNYTEFVINIDVAFCMV